MHIAIIGCGQLSRMMALAGIPMGFTFSFVADPDEDSRCVEGLGKIVRREFDTPVAELFESLGQPDVLTVEKEQVDVSLIESFKDHCPVHPNPKAFSACQHRHREKQLLDSLNIPCAPYAYGRPIDAANAGIPLPVVVKSCSEGYDGKNQWVLKSQQDTDAFLQEAEEDNYIVEQWIPFEREISQVSVRDAKGNIHHYPLAENHHASGILKQSIVPAPNASDALRQSAQDSMRRIMEELDYVGVMAMECFVVQEGDKESLLVNELAPRVHNSGHWTQAGSVTCQFGNHIRAITGTTLGATDNLAITGMFNLLGTEKVPVDELTPESSLHWYGKTVRPGRKLGHINIVSDRYDSLQQQLNNLQEKLG